MKIGRYHFVLDHLGAMSVLKGGEGLAVVGRRGLDVDDEARLRVAAQRVLEQPRELVVPVGHQRARHLARLAQHLQHITCATQHNDELCVLCRVVSCHVVLCAPKYRVR